jgi:S-formylglutathione hydrolase FrmB
MARLMMLCLVAVLPGILRAQVPAKPRADSLVSFQIAGHWVNIQYPNGPVRGHLLALPGWNYTRKSWCDNAPLCRQASAAGYVLVMPEMFRSVYAAQVYPETRADLRREPTRRWLIDTLLPVLANSHQLFLPGGRNFLIGLSTGGRGVAMVALHTDSLFRAGAALSGDYEQTKIPLDRLTTLWYGPYTRFPERWQGEENPAQQAGRFRTALYLGHGKADPICPWQQTQLFYDALRRANPRLPVKLNLPPKAGHDYAYWGAEIAPAFAFFEEVAPLR